MNMVREPVRDVVRDGLGGNPKKLRLLRKWFAMVRDLPDISRVRESEEGVTCANECGEGEAVEQERERNGLDREPSRTSLTTYQFAHWPTAEEAGIHDEDLLCRWEERVAICTIDGGLDEQDARRVAWAELMGTDEWQSTGCRSDQPTGVLAGLACGPRLNGDAPGGPQGVGHLRGSAGGLYGSFQGIERRARGGNGSEPGFFLSTARTQRKS